MFVPPPLICQCRPCGTKAFYLPVPPPVFVLLGHEQLAQHPAAVPHRPQCPSIRCQPDIFDIVGELWNDEASSPLCHNSSQKWQNQWCQWSENKYHSCTCEALLLVLLRGLTIPVCGGRYKVGDQRQCLTCTVQQLNVYCLFFDHALGS